jgi:hypothetical protein
LLGTFFGWVLGWCIYAYLPHDLQTDIAARTYSLLFSFIGWGIGVVFGQNRALHCGGTRSIETESDKSRHLAFLIMALFIAVLEMLFLAIGEYVIYSVIFVVTLVLFGSEIGWGDPWRILKFRLRSIAK